LLDLTFKRLSVENLHDFLNYFDHEAFTDNAKWSGCYCQFYLDDPAVTDPQTISTERNRQSACDRVASGEMQGYLAYSEGRVVGWCAAGSSKLFPGVPDADEKLARMLCFVIHPLFRGQGVARSLMQHAVADLATLGFAVVEAAPYTQPEQQAANYRGHLSMYLAEGFEAVQDMGEFGTLVRKHLD
jgi:ribosomal protein S18 acetylase RimI-like enzyme